MNIERWNKVPEEVLQNAEHRHMGLVQQWANGAEVEVEDPQHPGAWYHARTPTWAIDANYRVMGDISQTPVLHQETQAVETPRMEEDDTEEFNYQTLILVLAIIGILLVAFLS